MHIGANFLIIFNQSLFTKRFLLFYLLGSLENRDKGGRLKITDEHELSVAHYTGKVTYDMREMVDKNRDFLPPEMIDTLRLSSDKMVKLLFSNQLSRTGNLTMSAEDCRVDIGNMKSKWGAALMAENDNKTKVITSARMFRHLFWLK